MTYEEITRELSGKRLKLRDVRNQADSMEKELQSIEMEAESIKLEMRRSVDREKNIAESTYVDNSTSKYRLRIREIGSEVNELKYSYEEEKNSVNEEEIYAELKARETNLDNIDDTISSIKNTITDNLGERFFNEYSDQISRYSTDLDSEDLQKLIKKFSVIQEDVERLSSVRKEGFMDKVSDRIDGLSRKQLEADNKGALKLAGAGAVVLALSSVVVFPIYTVFLGYKIVANVKRNTIYSQAIVLHNLLESNLSQIEDVVRKKAEKEKDRILLEIDKEYEDKIQALEDEKSRLNVELADAHLQAVNSFDFDEDIVTRRFGLPNQALNNKRISVRNELEECNKEIEYLTSEIRELTRKQEEVVSQLKTKYLNFDKVGESKVFDPEFLFDIQDNKPVLFRHPQESSVVFYEDYEDMENFSKLIMSQLRSRLSPPSLVIQVWDTQRMGVSFGAFHSKVTELFGVAKDNDKMREMLSDLRDQISKRNETMLKEFSGIVEYNEYMLSIESVPETYYFVFLVNPEKSLFSDEFFRQMMLVGAKVGIYPMIFVEEENMSKEHQDLIKLSTTFYELTDTKIKKQAKQVALENVTKFGN